MNGHLWKTRAGETIPIAQMADNHLANAIKSISRAVVDKTNVTVKWLVILTVEAQRRGLEIQLPRLQNIIIATCQEWVNGDTRRLETYNIRKTYTLVCECGSDQLYPIDFDYWRSDDGCTYDLDLICYLCSSISTFSREYGDCVAYNTWHGKILRSNGKVAKE